MKIYEPEKAAEIWKRVQGISEPDAHSLLGLIQEEWTDSALHTAFKADSGVFRQEAAANG